MIKVVISDIAANDMADIAGYVAGDDPEAADRLTEAFFERFDLIGANPLLEERRHDLGPRVRQTVPPPYVIF